jgi:hypothetical protein
LEQKVIKNVAAQDARKVSAEKVNADVSQEKNAQAKQHA